MTVMTQHSHFFSNFQLQVFFLEQWFSACILVWFNSDLLFKIHLPSSPRMGTLTASSFYDPWGAAAVGKVCVLGHKMSYVTFALDAKQNPRYS